MEIERPVAIIAPLLCVPCQRRGRRGKDRRSQMNRQRPNARIPRRTRGPFLLGGAGPRRRSTPASSTAGDCLEQLASPTALMNDQRKQLDYEPSGNHRRDHQWEDLLAWLLIAIGLAVVLYVFIPPLLYLFGVVDE